MWWLASRVTATHSPARNRVSDCGSRGNRRDFCLDLWRIRNLESCRTRVFVSLESKKVEVVQQRKQPVLAYPYTRLPTWNLVANNTKAGGALTSARP